MIIGLFPSNLFRGNHPLTCRSLDSLFICSRFVLLCLNRLVGLCPTLANFFRETIPVKKEKYTHRI